MNILEKICEKKLSEIRVQKSHIEYKSKINISKRRDFLKNLTRTNHKYFNLIAEIKRFSPVRRNLQEI